MRSHRSRKTIGRVAELEYVPTGGYGRRADYYGDRAVPKKAASKTGFTRTLEKNEGRIGKLLLSKEG